MAMVYIRESNWWSRGTPHFRKPPYSGSKNGTNNDSTIFTTLFWQPPSYAWKVQLVHPDVAWPRSKWPCGKWWSTRRWGMCCDFTLEIGIQTRLIGILMGYWWVHTYIYSIYILYIIYNIYIYRIIYRGFLEQYFLWYGWYIWINIQFVG